VFFFFQIFRVSATLAVRDNFEIPAAGRCSLELTFKLSYSNFFLTVIMNSDTFPLLKCQVVPKLPDTPFVTHSSCHGPSLDAT
jgi:hypothetical protein